MEEQRLSDQLDLAKRRLRLYWFDLDSVLYGGSGVTDTQIARQIGISRATLWRWRRRLTLPSQGKFEAIAKLYGLKMDVDIRTCIDSILNKGMTRKQLAQSLGVRQNTLWRWYTGKCRPSELSLNALVEKSLLKPASDRQG
jgi:transcriptional regulator with XRE-family HTH domain